MQAEFSQGRNVRAEISVPRYKQVKSLILKQLRNHKGPEQILLPSESELVRTLGVSRMTVNRALRELAAEGLVTRVQGLGTFSAARKPELSVIDVRSIADEISGRGNAYACEIKLLRKERVSHALAQELDLPPGSPVFHSVVIHRENGVPIQIEDRYVNPQAAPDYLSIDFHQETPHHYLMRCSPLTDAEHLIEAGSPTKEERQMLKIKAGEPCLMVKRRTWSGALLCSSAILIHPGSRYRLVSRFSRTQGGHRIP